jgi:hypothetical protein
VSEYDPGVPGGIPVSRLSTSARSKPNNLVGVAKSGLVSLKKLKGPQR